MAHARNHHRTQHQTGHLHLRPFPSDFHPLRPAPPDSYGNFPPHYLPHPRQVAAENATRFWYLHQESINSLRHTMMNPSSLYDQRFSLPPPRFMHTNNGFFNNCPILPEDETVVLNLLDQRVPRFPVYQPPPRFEPRQNHTNGFSHQYYALLSEDETLILNLTSDQNMAYEDFFCPGTANGLSEETIVKHMKTRVSEAIRFTDNDEVCVVCQDNLFQENQKIATLNCGHEYHEECIKKWLIQKNNCPMCKATGLIVIE